MRIGNFNTNQKVLIIAEIGNNHEGKLSLAQKAIRAAAEAGVDAVKFQTIIPERLVSIKETERIKQLERFRFSYDQFEELHRTAKEEGVLFLSTPFDLESVDFLDSLVPAFKIASGDNNFFPLIEVICKKKKPIIISSGMADLAQIKKTKQFIKKIWNKLKVDTAKNLAILHCVVSYPAPPEQANLLAIEELKKLKVSVGYSDHTIGTEAAVLSVALGARIIEKHFTLDKNLSDFHDHKISSDPKEMKELVRRVREASLFLGSGVKELQECEKKILNKVRRSIVASRELSRGSIITLKDLGWVRPLAGLPPGEEKKIVGKKAKRSISVGEPILLSDLN